MSTSMHVAKFDIQNVTFYLVQARKNVLQSPTTSDKLINHLQQIVFHDPVVLVYQTPKEQLLHGRKDILKYLQGRSLAKVKWYRITLQ